MTGEKVQVLHLRHLLREDVCDNVDGVCFGLGSWSGRQEYLEKGNHVLGEGGEHVLVEDLGRGLLNFGLRLGHRVLGDLFLALDLNLEILFQLQLVLWTKLPAATLKSNLTGS